MRISHQGRFVYFSIPKTGSESVRALLDPVSDEPVLRFDETTPAHPFYSHMRPVEAAAALAARGHDMAGYLCVATVRNPWERLASLWRMMRRTRAFGPCPAFAGWVAMLADGTAGTLGQPGQMWYHHGLLSQHAFLSDARGRMLATHVWRIEDGLEELRTTLAARLPAGALPGPARCRTSTAPPPRQTGKASILQRPTTPWRAFMRRIWRSSAMVAVDCRKPLCDE